MVLPAVLSTQNQQQGTYTLAISGQFYRHFSVLVLGIHPRAYRAICPIYDPVYWTQTPADWSTSQYPIRQSFLRQAKGPFVLLQLLYL